MKKKNLMKKITAIALAAGMVFTSMPGISFMEREIVQASENYSISVTPMVASCEAGDTLTLKANIVDEEGNAVTHLDTAGLKLWWWTDYYNDHSDGKSDAQYSNYDNNSGLSLSADVTFPSAGTYYIAAQLDGVSTSYVTINVSEKSEAPESYSVRVLPSYQQVNEGDEVTMTAEVTNEAGNKVTKTDLETAGLHLWWWQDDAVIQNGDSGDDGYSLSAKFKWSEVGEYQIKAELKDSSGTWKAGAYPKVTVLEQNQQKVTYDLSVSASKKSYIQPGDTVTLTANYSASDGSEVTIGEDYQSIWYSSDDVMGGCSDVEFVSSEECKVYVDGDGKTAATVSGNSIQVTLPSVGEYYITNNLKDKDENELAHYTIKLSTKGIEDVYVEKLELDNDFIKGVDISSLEAELESGVNFYDFNGKKLDEAGFFKLLKECGMNWVRIRVWNDPSDGNGNGYGGGNCDLDKAKSMGKYATEAGLRVLIDFHYSDTWADPKRQLAPKAWKDKTEDERIQLIESYTYDSVKALLEYGVDVGMVQVGNETTNKICDISENEGVGEGSTIKPMQKMCEAFNAGAKGVRDAAKDKNTDIKVAIHIESPQAEGKYANYAKALHDFNVDYDVFASSYYPMWHGSLENLQTVLSDIATTYKKDVLVAETSWAYTGEDGDGHGNEDDGTEYDQYEHSVQGQVNELYDVTKTIANTTNGIGVFYWEPAWIPVNYIYDDADAENYRESAKKANQIAWEKYGSGWATNACAVYDPDNVGTWAGGSSVDNHAWFDWYGYPLASLKAFKYMETGKTTLPKSVWNVVADDVLAYVGMPFETPKVRIRYNYGEDKIAQNVTWNQQEITDARNKGVGTYTIHGTVTDSGETYDVSFELTIEKYNYLADKDYSFEDGKNAWTIEGGSESAVWKILANDPKSGDKALKYDKALTDASAYQTITLNKGTYTFGGFMQGEVKADGESYEIFVKIGNETKTAEATPKGWYGNAGWQNPEITDIEITANNTPVTVGCKVTTTSAAWGTWDDFYINKTSTDDESGNGDNGSTGDNNGGSNNNSGSTPTTPTTPPTNTKPDTTTETKPDGSTVETKTETKEDGTKVETVTETATDGSKKETVVETKPDGKKVEKITETATDGSKVETKKESETNTAGKQVEVSTVTKTDADGKVASVVEKSTISEVAKNTTATVTVKKDGEGAVTSATASVAATIEGKKTSLSADVIAQVQEASGQKDVTVTVTAKNDEGKTLYKVKVDTKDLTADNALYIYKVDSKTGELVMVNSKTYKVDENGGLDISIKNKATYELVSKAEAKAIEKQIKATVKVQNSSKDVKKGKTTKVAFDKKMNMNNVKSITYQTADKKIATVSKSGKVTAKAKGTVTVKATVTLKNGSKKTVTMKIKVK